MPQFTKDYVKNANLQKGFNAELVNQLVNYILRVLPTAKITPIKVLDLCCGDGGVTNAIADALESAGIQLEKIVGYDISQEQIEVAKQYEDGVNRFFKEQDVAAMSDINEYDVIISLFGLHWLADINDAAARIHEALKPEGKLFFFVPLEKNKLFEFRQILVNSERWKPYFNEFELKPFHYDPEIYRDAFIPFFQDENPEAISGTQQVDFNTDRFKQFLSSWLPELRLMPTEKEKQDYLEELINLFPEKGLTACPDVEKNSSANNDIVFYERILFFSGEKTKASTSDPIASPSLGA
ncbi:MAG: class I SAM-dependent methyltransferase [Legionella sp.]|uniref:class I SAM-dependent methyltransferase n=1 Tax=Legionella sp. TaxID=459 RepID=UPI00283D6344|nr:class I SAM-dependent methyltransferase [Legionella sp.]